MAAHQDTKQTKRERSQQRREQAQRKKSAKRIVWGLIAVMIAALAIYALAHRQPLPGEKVDVMKDQSHIPDVNSPHIPYHTDPPTSGQHLPYIAQWGVHKEPLPKELLVHNLEDGGVVIYYSSQAGASDVQKLEQIVDQYPEHVLVNPYPEMKNPITLTAWGRMMRLDQFDEKSIQSFIRAFQGIDHH